MRQTNPLYARTTQPAGLYGDELSRAWNPSQPDADYLETHHWTGSNWKANDPRTSNTGGSFYELAADHGYVFEDDQALELDETDYSGIVERDLDKLVAATLTVCPAPPPEPETLYTIGQLAKLLDRKVYTIQRWIADGVIPDAPIRTKGNMRRWPERYVEGMLTIMREEKCIKPNTRHSETNMTARVFDLYRRLDDLDSPDSV